VAYLVETTTVEKGNLTVKQKVWMPASVVSLTMPIVIFIFLYSQSFSPRQIAAIEMANMIAVVSLGDLILTKWISKIR
jgi:hypothetical protein